MGGSSQAATTSPTATRPSTPAQMPGAGAEPFHRPGTDDGPLQRLFDWTYRTHPRTTARVARLEGRARDMATRPPD